MLLQTTANKAGRSAVRDLEGLAHSAEPELGGKTRQSEVGKMRKERIERLFLKDVKSWRSSGGRPGASPANDPSPVSTGLDILSYKYLSICEVSRAYLRIHRERWGGADIH
ncbi:unnamed protein product [Nezara viridula]|uniref:Uncharacterized protein n=1 Tax=Nezara viridula TaxID=85310 RepID=A0A9P0HFV4_NEZVI|nr:unnamed protein product [Nezara viridula]